MSQAKVESKRGVTHGVETEGMTVTGIYFYLHISCIRKRDYHITERNSSEKIDSNCSEISRTDILRGTNRIFYRVLHVDSPYFTPLLMYNNTISIFQNITIIDGYAVYRKSLGGTCR